MLKRTSHKPQIDPEAQVEGFCMFTKSDIAKVIALRLTASQLRLWLYLNMLDPFADQTSDQERIYHPIPTPVEIAIAIGCHHKVVEKDLKLLRDLGLYEYRVTGLEGHNSTAQRARAESERMKSRRTQVSRQAKPTQPQNDCSYKSDLKSLECSNKNELHSLNSKECYLGSNLALFNSSQELNNSKPELNNSSQELNNSSGIYIDRARDQTNQTNQRNTHNAAPAPAAPAPHPDVCVSFLNKEEEEQEAASQVVAEIELAPTPGSVGQLIKDFAQKKSLNQGTKSAALQRRKNHSTTIEWNCPGSPEEKVKFLEWKGDLLVKAGKCFKEEARGFALSWAKKNAEEATLIFEDWRKGRNQPPASVPSSGSVPVVSTAPDFETQTKSWHANLVAVYRQEGEEAFLALEEWHLDWIDHVRTYRPKLLEG